MAYPDRKGNPHATRAAADQANALYDLAAQKAREAAAIEQQTGLHEESLELQREHLAAQREESARHERHRATLVALEQERVELEREKMRIAEAESQAADRERSYRILVEWLKDSDDRDRLMKLAEIHADDLKTEMTKALVAHATSRNADKNISKLVQSREKLDAIIATKSEVHARLTAEKAALAVANKARAGAFYGLFLFIFAGLPLSILGLYVIVAMAPVFPDWTPLVLGAVLLVWMIIRAFRNRSVASAKAKAAQEAVNQILDEIAELTEKITAQGTKYDALCAAHGNRVVEYIREFTSSEQRSTSLRAVIEDTLTAAHKHLPSAARIRWANIADEDIEAAAGDLIAEAGEISGAKLRDEFVAGIWKREAQSTEHAKDESAAAYGCLGILLILGAVGYGLWWLIWG